MEVQESAGFFKTHRKLIILILSISALLLIAAAVVITLDGRHVRFQINGPAELTVAYGEPFQDPGFTAVSNGELFGAGSYPLPTLTEGEVDTGKLGDYTLTYKAYWLLMEYHCTRLVHVADLKAPVITLKEKPGYEPSWFTGYEEEGYSALDDHDGDLSDKVTRTPVGDTIVYSVTDGAGNTATAVRELHYTIAVPEIRLLGEAEQTMSAGLSYVDPGYTAGDSLGNDLSGYVHVEGQVIPYEPGEYQILYSISNDLGETVSATRTVTVLPVRNPDTVTPDGKTIYLTFDDGPGPYTEDLLAVLNKYNVKATFFVTCLNPDYNYLIGLAYSQGHAIGVHSASHNYYQIYASEQAFFDDFNQVESMIYQQTGTYTKLFRFPGGSSNTVSSFNPGIMSRLASAMTNMGYVYFDWNVSSGDAGGTTQTRQVVQNIVDGCSQRNASVVLQHDIKDYSVNAVEQVILWALNNGYVFRALDATSPNAHHSIAN